MTRRKNISVIIFTLLMIISICGSVFAKGAWKKFRNNWRYENHAGSGDYITEKFKAIYDSDGVTEKVYYFDYYGDMATGNVLINFQLYAFGEDGAAITTGIDIDGVHYATEGNGKVVGLPKNFDLSRFPSVYSVANDININSGQANVYDDKNNITPTAGANN